MTASPVDIDHARTGRPRSSPRFFMTSNLMHAAANAAGRRGRPGLREPTQRVGRRLCTRPRQS